MSSELTASQEIQEWSASDMVVDHVGEEVVEGTETTSFVLTVSRDGKSFKCVFRDESETTTEIEGNSRIEYLYPSVEGTVIICQMEDGTKQAYDPRIGQRLFEEDLRKIQPHFYS